MTLPQIAFLALVFIGVFGVAMFGLAWLTPSAASERLRRLAPADERRTSRRWIERVAQVSAPLAKLSLPEEGAEQSGLRKRFMNAGFRSASAPLIYFGAKTLLAVAVPTLAYLSLLSIGSQLQFSDLLMVLLAAVPLGDIQRGWLSPNSELVAHAEHEPRILVGQLHDHLVGARAPADILARQVDRFQAEGPMVI